MQKCSACGADLPEHSRFCGKCGSVQVALATEAAPTTRGNTPQPPSWVPEDSTLPAPWPPSSNYPRQGSTPVWSPNIPAPITPPPGAQDEDERRRGIPPWSPLYGAALGDALLGSGPASPPSAPGVQGAPQVGGLAYTSGTPGVQGTPQIGGLTYTSGASGVQGTPPIGGGLAHTSGMPGMPGTPQIGSIPSAAGSPAPYTNTLAGPPAQPQANVPAGPPARPQANPPVARPAQGQVNAPSPQMGPRPMPSPPVQPGAQEQHPAHKRREHRTHHTQHAANVTKAAGGVSAKAIALVVAAVVVVAGGIAAAAHFLAPPQSLISRPQPLISISSKYKVGNTPAGAQGTTLHISGQKFASNATITFLLDGHAAPGNPSARSDANGNVSADVAITNAWSIGTHTLTAKDASNDSTKDSVSVTIVQPGQANTPGPNGAPPDNATFTLTFTENATNGAALTRNEVMLIKGHPDSARGTACLDRDDGRQHSLSRSFSDNTPYTETDTFSCQGSYESGKISYSETLLTGVVTYTNGSGVSVICTLVSPPPLHQQVTGSYTGNGSFTGTFTFVYTPVSDYSCSDGSSFGQAYTYGTWTGTVSDLQR